MKHLIFLALIQFCACMEPETPRAVLVALETPFTKPVQRAYNIGQTSHGICAYYTDSDTEFCLYFNQCVVMTIDGETHRIDCDVYQTAPGIWVADLGGGEFAKVNTETGRTNLYFAGRNRTYTNERTP